MFSHLRVLLPPSLPLGRHPLLRSRGREEGRKREREEEWEEGEKGHKDKGEEMSERGDGGR